MKRFFPVTFLLGLALSTLNSRAASAEGRALCFQNEREISALKASIKANAKTNLKYESYQRLLQEATSKELLARLAYAETLAANCPEQNHEILPLIITAIANRVALRAGDVRSVVFERDQFSSSLNIYPESRFRDFLCPKDKDLWLLALKSAEAALEKPHPLRGLSAESVHYFLYRHSPRWTKEPWKLTEDPAAFPQSLRKCVRFFKNPQWK